MDAHPRNRAGRFALRIYAAALKAVRADALIRRHLKLRGHTLQVGRERVDLRECRRVFVLGAGKASAAMAQAVEAALGERITEGAAVTKHGHALPTERIRILEAGHPVPDEGSLRAGRAILDLASEAGEEDLVLFLLSGGASALMELPVEGVRLEDLQAATGLLLRAGANINELNAVRACLSRIKAGGLARAAAPARLICLVISDVLGNPLEVIGSGPCCDTGADPARARAVVEQYGLADKLPESVLEALHRRDSHERSPARRASARASHVILADVWTALEAARREAERVGLNPLVLTGSLQGEAREAGAVAGAMAKDLPRTAGEREVACYLLGGETTVTVRGPGKGGRCQELAFAAARVMEGTRNGAVLAAGTDGTDGPTDAAGAVVDGSSYRRAGEAGKRALEESSTYAALDAAGDLIRTGATQSNVNDLVMVVYTAE